MRTTGLWLGVATSMLLASMATPSAAKTPARGLWAQVAKPIAALRFQRVYRQKLREQNVPRLKRKANRLYWRVTLTSLNPWTKRTTQDLINDVQAASKLSNRATLGTTHARTATIQVANKKGITPPTKVIEKWKHDGFDLVHHGTVKPTAPKFAH